jgi:hypothetical protein
MRTYVPSIAVGSRRDRRGVRIRFHLRGELVVPLVHEDTTDLHQVHGRRRRRSGARSLVWIPVAGEPNAYPAATPTIRAAAAIAMARFPTPEA